MLVVVTGAGGHIGSNLVPLLVEQGHQVRAIDKGPSRYPTGTQVTWESVDVRDEEEMRRALDGADAVIHLAAVISVAGDRGGLVPSVNVDGARTTALAAQHVGVGRFVHCSSIHAFDLDACRGSVVTEQSPRATSAELPAYDRSKYAGEQAVLNVAAAGLPAVVVNPTGIVGPVDLEPSRMGVVLRTAASGRLPASVRGTFDWVDVRDVASAMVAALTRGEVGESYILGGHSAGLREMAAVACAESGRRAPVADLPMWTARMLAPLSTALARRSHNPLLYTDEALHAIASSPNVSHAKAERVLGHRPRPLAETVVDLVRAFGLTAR